MRGHPIGTGPFKFGEFFYSIKKEGTQEPRGEFGGRPLQRGHRLQRAIRAGDPRGGRDEHAFFPHFLQDRLAEARVKAGAG